MSGSRRARRIAAALPGALFLLVARDASAFCRTTTCDPTVSECRLNQDGCVRDGVPLVWKELPIVYRFHSAGSSKLAMDEARAAVRRAFDSWENVQCRSGRTSLRFQEGPEIEEDKALGAERGPSDFGIYFRDDEWPHDDEGESLALTNQVYGKVTGTIDYADIEVNTATARFALTDLEDGLDLQAVITHEVGHYIGLAHSNDPDSIMVARYCQSADRCGQSVDVARSLAPDDIRAVCVLYPPPSDESPEPAAACAEAPVRGERPGAGAVALLVLGVAAVARRRSPRRRRDASRLARP